MIRFGIVVPTLNSELWVAELWSSICKATRGEFETAVHFQDGGSTDKTLHLIERFRVDSRQSKQLSVSIEVRPDNGVAEAINRGFGHMDATVLSWIGSDDLIRETGLSTVHSFLSVYPNTPWVTGVPARTVFPNGVQHVTPQQSTRSEPLCFSRFQLATGLHGGSILGYVQQEGTFFSNDALEEIGGRLNEDLRLAFDFELWCRLARWFPLTVLSEPIAIFRRRSGQLSEDKKSYHQEVKGVRHAQFARLGSDYRAFVESRGLVGVSAHRVGNGSNWSLRSHPVSAYFKSRARTALRYLESKLIRN